MGEDSGGLEPLPVSEVTGSAQEVLPCGHGTRANVPAAAVLAGMELIHRGLRCKVSARRARPMSGRWIRVGLGHSPPVARLLSCLTREFPVVVSAR